MPNIAFCAPLQRNWRVMWEGVRSSQNATRIYLYLSNTFYVLPKDKEKKNLCLVEN